MRINAFAKHFFIMAVATAGIVPAMLAGPEPLADRSKDKEVQMEQQAPLCDPRWYISIGGGADFDLGSTKISHGFDANVFADTPASFFTPFDLHFRSHDWSDVYDNAWRIQGELGYVLSQHLEVFGRFKYEHADSAGRTSGDHIVVGGRNGFRVFLDFPVSTEFSDYSSWGGELGFRFFFLPKESRLRPYVAFSGGASHVDSIDFAMFADFTGFGDGGPGFDFLRGSFFEDSWVGTASAVLGLEVALNCHWALGVEGGARYDSKLSPDDSTFTGRRLILDPLFANFPLRPFRPINNDSGDRWTVPVTGYVKFRF
jgi:hypothetical protein